MKNTLELNGLSKTFEEKTVLKDFSLNLKQGELCCLLGPSGCGKSTTLKIIAGFLKPDKGSVFLNGNDISFYTPQERNVGLVFQNYALFPHLNVFENIAYGLRRRKQKKGDINNKVAEMLNMVQMDGMGHRYIHELSGGQQQRVALARSLVTNPDLLLLDEPLSNLDAKLRIHMRNEIVRIQKNLNLTTVYVTHDQEEAMSIADRIVVMNHGSIEQNGRSQEIYEKPASLFVADFIGSVNLITLKTRDRTVDFFGNQIDLPGDVAGNKEVVCTIRPEVIELAKENTSSIQATIKSKSYLGSLVHYWIEPKDSHHELLVEVSGPKAFYANNDKVSVMIKPGDVRFFSR